MITLKKTSRVIRAPMCSNIQSDVSYGVDFNVEIRIRVRVRANTPNNWVLSFRGFE